MDSTRLKFTALEAKEMLLKKFASVFLNCKICGNSFESEKKFYAHCLKHFTKPQNKISVVLCSECCQSFNTVEDAKKHMEHVHKIKHVAQTASSPINLQIRGASDDDCKRQKQKPDNKIKLNCSRKGCKAAFEAEEHLEMHVKCHLEDESKIFCCPFCTALFPSWTPCVFHLFRAHAIECGLLKCPFCEMYRTTKELALKNHMRVHSDLRSFLCKTCGKTFKQASQLRNHNSTTHASDAECVLRKKWKQCTVCFKLYSDAKSLKKHKEEVHNKLRPFVCNVCGHASARKSLLVLHQRQHTNHKSSMCHICDYKTADYNSLRNHMMRHTGVRPYRCTECNFSSIKSSNLKVHVKRKHSESVLVFSCSKCTFKTVSEDHYTRHVSDHLTGLIKDSETERASESVPEESSKEIARGFPAWVSADSF